MRSKAFLVAMAALTAIVGFSPVAGADPKGQPFDLVDCTGEVPDGQIVTNNGNGPLTPGFATDSTGVYIPYALELTFSIFDSQGNTLEQFAESNAKANVPRNNLPKGDCFFDETFPVGEGIFARFVGKVSVFYTG